MASILPTSSNNQLNQLVAGNKKESTEVKKKISPDQLPTEAFSKILSFLSPENFQSIASVSTNWKKRLIESTKLVELSRFKSLASFLERQFEETKLKTKQEILQDTNDAIHRSVKSLEEVIEHLPNLSSLKKRLLEDKDTTVAILQNLEKDDISALKTQAYGVDMPKGVFELADAYKLLDEALKITDTLERNKKLLVIPKKLSEKGYFGKAIEITNFITDNRYKYSALSEISMAVLESGDHEEALKIANLMPDNFYNSVDNERKYRALFKISMAVLESGDHEEALKIANLLPTPCPFNIQRDFCKYELLSEISMAVIESEGHEKAIKIANLITDDEYKYSALSKISITVTKSKGHEKALEIANLITDDEYKYSALSKISIAVTKSEGHEKALEIANLIPDCHYKEEALLGISMAVLESGDHDEALEIANLIPDNDDKYRLLYKISIAATKSGDHEKAIKVVNLIQGEIFIFSEKPRLCSPLSEISKSLFEEISKSLHENKNIGKALKIANLIPLKDLKDKALSEIYEAIKKTDNNLDSDTLYELSTAFRRWEIEKAIEFARLIPEKEYKCRSLHWICKDLIQSKDTDKALLVINLFPQETDNHKTFLLYQISKILNDGINTYKAIEVANLIPLKGLKDKALSEISSAVLGKG